jgi:DNA polymerase elongation subunit (family B)
MYYETEDGHSHVEHDEQFAREIYRELHESPQDIPEEEIEKLSLQGELMRKVEDLYEAHADGRIEEADILDQEVRELEKRLEYLEEEAI